MFYDNPNEEIHEFNEKLINFEHNKPVIIKGKNYDKSARILTTLIFSIMIILCYIGFIFSGFILNQESASNK